MKGISARIAVDFGGFDLDFGIEIPGHGVTAIFGHSGSGKTTALRAIAGLERFKGHVTVLGEVWQDERIFLPPHSRRVGYVFQEANLFPHLDVRGNLEYGRKRRGSGASIEETSKFLNIGSLLSRMPEKLSGGERQRVAIARALVSNPRLLLMDEPLASLDVKARREIMPYLEKLGKELNIPIIYVSHSPDEVASLADHLILMEKGRVIASGPIFEMMTRLDLPLGQGDSAESVIEASVCGKDIENHLLCVEFSGGKLFLPYQNLEVGEKVRVRILARDVSLALEQPEKTSIINILPATVEAVVESSPGQIMVKLSLGGTPLLSHITLKSAKMLELSSGLNLYAQIKGIALLK